MLFMLNFFKFGYIRLNYVKMLKLIKMGYTRLYLVKHYLSRLCKLKLVKIDLIFLNVKFG